MDHYIERIPGDGFRRHEEVLFRTRGKGDVLCVAVLLIALAPISYFKGVPHDSATTFAVCSALAGVVSLILASTKHELTFKRKARTLEVRWFVLGAAISVQESKFDELKFFVRWWTPARNSGAGETKAMLAVKDHGTVFLFPRPEGSFISEKDIPPLLDELGISAGLPNPISPAQPDDVDVGPTSEATVSSAGADQSSQSPRAPDPQGDDADQMVFTATEPGAIEVVDGVLTYRSSHYGMWWLPLRDIWQIEEYKLPDASEFDDHCYRFSTATKEERTASFNAVGWENVWPVLSAALPGLEQPGLGESTESKARVLWTAAGDPSKKSGRKGSPVDH